MSRRSVDGVPLSVSDGIAGSGKPTEEPALLRKRADDLQYKAKERSRAREPRCGTIAVEGNEQINEFEMP